MEPFRGLLRPSFGHGLLAREGIIQVYQGGICLELPRARDRDRELSALFLDHYDPLRRLAYVMLGDGQQAEEVVMEAFAKAMTKWNLFSRAEHPHAYMRQIVVNLCRSKIRRFVLERKVTEMFKHDEERREPVAGVEAHGLNMDVWAAVMQLPERQRACIVLRYLEDMTEPEVAEVLNVPVGTVKSQLNRARGKLSKMLDDVSFEES